MKKSLSLENFHRGRVPFGWFGSGSVKITGGSWNIKGVYESVARVDSPVPLMYHDPSDPESLILIQITLKEPCRQGVSQLFLIRHHPALKRICETEEKRQ